MNRADFRHTTSASATKTCCRYNYDANGNLAGIDDSRKGNRSYHYDPLDRLISVRGAMPESFSHDPAGNLLGQNDLPVANLANVKGNRLLMQGDRHYDYDAYGNLIRESRGTGQKLVTEYRYDCQHRLIGVSLPGGSTATYKYDAFGRRIEKTVDGHTTEFLWQGERLIAESAENRYRSYIYEPGSFRPLAMLDGEGPLKAAPFYYQLDHLGTPQELTDYSGEIMWSAKYRAYGNLAALDVSEIDNPLRFQGQYFDAETGLHYNRHRYYNPGTGRFLTPDPIKLAGGLNSYQYVPNPTGWVDPLGLSGCPGQTKFTRNDKFYGSRRAAFQDAKRDARIPMSAEPMEVNHVALTKIGEHGVGKQNVLDRDGNMVYTREYHYKNIDNERVIIQEHSYGHEDFPSDHASHKPHFNVREYDPETGNADRTRTFHLQSISNHYVFE